MFCLWMRQHPNGQRPDEDKPFDGKYYTAKEYWTALWDEFLSKHVITHNTFDLASSQHKQHDPYLRAFEELYKKTENPRNDRNQTGAAPGGGGGGGGGGGFSGNRGGNGGGGRGGWSGRGRGFRSQFTSFHDHSHDLSHPYPPEEESFQISDMQYEIDSLRRSLNQLALLQG